MKLRPDWCKEVAAAWQSSQYLIQRLALCLQPEKGDVTSHPVRKTKISSPYIPSTFYQLTGSPRTLRRSLAERTVNWQNRQTQWTNHFQRSLLFNFLELILYECMIKTVYKIKSSCRRANWQTIQTNLFDTCRFWKMVIEKGKGSCYRWNNPVFLNLIYFSNLDSKQKILGSLYGNFFLLSRSLFFLSAIKLNSSETKLNYRIQFEKPFCRRS